MKGGVRAYARHRGADPMAVEKALRTGRIQRDADGQIDFEKADEDWERNTRPQASPEDKERQSHYSRSRAIREFYQANLARVDYDERIGKLLPKDEVQAAALHTYCQFRERIFRIPGRVAVILAAETGRDTQRVREILAFEVRRALNDFSTPDAI
jgi:hypothetical protein